MNGVQNRIEQKKKNEKNSMKINTGSSKYFHCLHELERSKSMLKVLGSQQLRCHYHRDARLNQLADYSIHTK